MRCLICGSTSLGALYEGIRDRYGVADGEYRFLRCHACGSATLDAPPAAEDVAALYPARYTFNRADGERSGLRATLAALEWRLFYEPTYRRRVTLFRRLTGLRQGRVLEIGCGPGLLLVQLRDAGYDVEGVELSTADATHGRERYGLAIREGRVETLPLERDRYDAVVMMNVVEHILDPAAVVARAMAGHFQAARELLDGDSTSVSTGRGGRRFTHDELVDLLVMAGLQPSSVQAVRVFADLVPGSLLDLEPGATAALVELERAVATRPEYLPLATQLHVIARR